MSNVRTFCSSFLTKLDNKLKSYKRSYKRFEQHGGKWMARSLTLPSISRGKVSIHRVSHFIEYSSKSSFLALCDVCQQQGYNYIGTANKDVSAMKKDRMRMCPCCRHTSCARRWKVRGKVGVGGAPTLPYVILMCFRGPAASWRLTCRWQLHCW